MKNKLRILFLSSEVEPFAKTGGLADVASALPRALYEEGHDVRVMMPKYGVISDRKYILRDVIRLKKIAVKMGNKEYITSAKSAFLPDSKVQIYFLNYKTLFDKKGLYVDPKTGKDFANNAERFALFCRAVLETIKILHWEPNVIHCNDWQTALVPWLLKNDYGEDSFFANTATLLSIHNMAYQGNFPPTVLPKIGLAKEFGEPGSDMEFYGNINFLKLGILHADSISTVSPTYADEIQSNEELGAGLNEFLKARKKDLHGILNGVDETIWNPEKDSFLPAFYSPSDLEGKSECKKTLLQESKLEYKPEMPVVGMISRLDSQKGFDLLDEIREDLFKLDLQFVVLGVGDPRYHKMLQALQKKYPDKVSIHLRFDDRMAHLIEAGSDIFLMPSRYEPCGLNQMFSLKYGTIPVVHNVGGLADTITDYTENRNQGNGFIFTEYSGKAFLQAIQRALEEFSDKKSWQKLVKRAMKQNFSWKASADKYVKLYQKMI